MKALLVVNGFISKNKNRFQDLYDLLIDAFNSKEIQLILVSNEQILSFIDNDKRNEEYKFIIFWDKDILLAKHLENLGYKVFNSSKAIEICDNKAKTALALENKGIKMPKTIIAPFTFSNNPYDDYTFLDYVISSLGLPLIIKENYGSFGEQVYLVNSKDELIEKIKELVPKEILFQEYIKSSFGTDVRIEIVGDKVIGAVCRCGKNNEFRSNVLQGGKMMPFNPPLEYINMALKVTKIIGLDFAGVDIMFGSNQEPIFCEVNSNVHFKTFYKVTGINLANEIADYVINKIK